MGWGFCTRLTGAELLKDRARLTSMDFAYALVRAEGLDPETSEFTKKIKKRFELRYRTDQISPSEYQRSYIEGWISSD